MTCEAAPRQPRSLVEWVTGQSGADARRDGGRGGAAGLAASLVLEGRSELGDERQSRAAPKHLGAKVRGPRIDVAAGDVERRALTQQVALRVQGRIDLVPHVSDDDLLDPIAPLGRPASARAETQPTSPPASSNGA